MCQAPSSRFSQEFRAAQAVASFAYKEVWKQLQSGKAQAALELTSLLEGWRNTARTRLQEAIQRLPTDLADRGLDATLEEPLAKPLNEFLATLDGTNLPVRVAAFPDRAGQLIRALGNRIGEEVHRKENASKPEVVVPQKEIRQVRPDDVTIAEWEVFRNKLDQRVRKLLEDGFDVELL